MWCHYGARRSNVTNVSGALVLDQGDIMKRKFKECADLSQDGTPITEQRGLGIGIESALLHSLKSLPPVANDFVEFHRARDERNGQDIGHIAVELSEDTRTLIVSFTLAIRVLLAALGVNISRVDVRPNRHGSDGYHDVAGDIAGVIDVVGEIKCRLQSLRDGVAYKPHGVAICKGVLSDYEGVRQTRFPDRPIAMLILCTISRTPGQSWVFPTLRLAICSNGAWYSGYQWPSLPPWREQRLLLPGFLPSRTELENKVRSAFLPRLQQQPQPVQRVQAPEPVVAAKDVATVFVAIVPRRKTCPAHAPASWARLYTLLTPFEGRRGG